MEPISLEDLDEIDLLLTGLELSQGKGNLILCTIASPAYREKVIEVIKARYSSRVQVVETGDKLISDLRNIKSEKEEIVIWILPERLSEDILEALNNFRELFYDAGVPSLVFITPAGLDEVIWKAQDFWRYRGGCHILKGGEEGPGLQALDAPSISLELRYKSREELLSRKRINEYLLDLIRKQNKSDKVKILTDIGTVHLLLSEPRKAIEYYDQALTIASEIGDRKRKGEALVNLGLASADLGDARKAIEYYDQALTIVREIGDSIGEGNALHALSRALSYLGRREEALKAVQEAADIRRKLAGSNPRAFLPDLAMSLGTYGRVLLALERHSDAASAFAEGLQHLAPFYRKLPHAFTGLAHALRRGYLEACKMAEQEPDRDLLSQFN